MDWNWFFSALAQSAAAIVGILGAFIVSKILSNQSTFTQRKNYATELLNGCRRIADEVKDLDFCGYNDKTSSEQILRLKDFLFDGEVETAEEFYSRLEFSVFLSKNDALDLIEQEIATYNPSLRPAIEFGVLPPHRLVYPYDLSGQYRLNFLGANRGDADVSRKKSEIYAVLRDAKHHSRKVKEHLKLIEDNPESSGLITCLLVVVAFLFFSGVIYPLSFLPAPIDGEISVSIVAFLPMLFSFKGMLLAAVSILFTIILGIFFWLNLSMKYPNDDIDNLRRFQDFDVYSPYFKTMRENLGGRANLVIGVTVSGGDGPSR